MTRSVGVCDSFGVAERFEEGAKCADLICGFRLPFGVGGESEELIYKEGAAEALSRACYPPCACDVSAKTRCTTTQKPQDDHT